jgi:deoxyribonuclease V
MTIAIVDASYSLTKSAGALVLADDWSSSAPSATAIEVIETVAEYEPSAFYKRELPVILKLLEHAASPALAAIIIDGYCTLDAGRPGLGARLFEAIHERCPIVGVAKTRFYGANAQEVLRGGSKVPLHVTAVGLDATTAADRVRSMHGAYRIPTLLKEADRLARSAA